MSDPLKLAERCEEAAGANRELDCEIHCAIKGWQVIRDGNDFYATGYGGNKRFLVGWIDPGLTARNFSMSSDSFAPSYTGSLDAAMTLVPEGWQVETLGQQSDSRWWTVLLRPLVADEGAGTVIRRAIHERAFDGAMPALAVCAAALRARAAIAMETGTATAPQSDVVAKP